MAEQLKTTERQQRHEIADVQTVGSGVEAAVKRRGRGEALGQFRRVRAVGDEAAPVEFVQNAHGRRLDSRAADANTDFVACARFAE